MEAQSIRALRVHQLKDRLKSRERERQHPCYSSCFGHEWHTARVRAQSTKLDVCTSGGGRATTTPKRKSPTLRPMRSPTLLPMRMKAAETRASRATAD